MPEKAPKSRQVPQIDNTQLEASSSGLSKELEEEVLRKFMDRISMLAKEKEKEEEERDDEEDQASDNQQEDENEEELKQEESHEEEKKEEVKEPQPSNQLAQGDDMIEYKCISFKRGEQITYEIKSIHFQKKNDDIVGIAFWVQFSNKSKQKLVPLSELWEASNQEAREMLLKELKVQKRKFPRMANILQAVFDEGAANENDVEYHDIDNPEYT